VQVPENKQSGRSGQLVSPKKSMGKLAPWDSRASANWIDRTRPVVYDNGIIDKEKP
jgi:hypothetical protein